MSLVFSVRVNRPRRLESDRHTGMSDKSPSSIMDPYKPNGSGAPAFHKRVAMDERKVTGKGGVGARLSFCL